MRDAFSHQAAGKQNLIDNEHNVISALLRSLGVCSCRALAALRSAPEQIILADGKLLAGGVWCQHVFFFCFFTVQGAIDNVALDHCILL